MTFKTVIYIYIVVSISNFYSLITFGEILKKNETNIDLQKIGSYIVSISEGKENPKHICSGTVLTNRWILTATRCVAKNNFQTVNESFLYYYISNPKILKGKLIPVEEILIHPNFYTSKILDYDITLMKLKVSLGNFSGNNTKLEKRTVDLPEDESDFKTLSFHVNKTENITNFDKNIMDKKNCCFVAGWVKIEGHAKNITLDLKVLPATIRKKNSTFEIVLEQNGSQLPLGAAFISNDTQYAMKTGKNSTDWTPVKLSLSWISSMISRHSNAQKIIQQASSKSNIDLIHDEAARLSKLQNSTKEIKNETMVVRRFSEKGGNKNITETDWFKGFIISLLVGLGLFLALIPTILCCECKISARGWRAARQGVINLDERPYGRPSPPPLSLIRSDLVKDDGVDTRNSKSSMTVGGPALVEHFKNISPQIDGKGYILSKPSSPVSKVEDL